MTRLPDILHTSAETYDGTPWDIALDRKNPFTEEPVLVGIPHDRKGTRRTPAEVLFEEVNSLGFGEIIRAYRSLREHDIEPTPAHIESAIRGDTSLGGRLARVTGNTVEVPDYWFNGFDNTCQIRHMTPDQVEYVLFDEFTSLLLSQRSMNSGIHASGSREGGRYIERDFTAQMDWYRGLGVGALPQVIEYFPGTEISFEHGSKRKPIPSPNDWSIGRRMSETESFMASVVNDPNTHVIDFADLPEDPRAREATIAMQAINFFTGGSEETKELSVDPEFESLIEPLREGLITVHNMRAAGEPPYAIDDFIMNWNNQNGREGHGIPVTVHPQPGVRFDYDAPSCRGYSYCEGGVFFEGYIARACLSYSGGIVLAAGLRHDNQPGYVPLTSEFTWVDIPVLGAKNWSDTKFGPESFEPLSAIKKFIETELPKSDDLLQVYDY